MDTPTGCTATGRTDIIIAFSERPFLATAALVSYPRGFPVLQQLSYLSR